MRKAAIMLAGFLFLLGLMLLIWEVTGGITPEELALEMEGFENDPVAPFITVVAFIVAGICFFPLTVMTIATAMTFGPIQGILISVSGAISAAAVTYWMGYILGHYGLRKWMGELCDRLQKHSEEIGVLGMTALRLVFWVPYTMGNMAFGIIGQNFIIFIAGSFFALIPGAIVRSILGASIMDFWENPDPKNMAFIAAGILGWSMIVLLTHIMAKKWRGGDASRPHKKSFLRFAKNSGR